jgi:CheY-like chemotaxis protein
MPISVADTAQQPVHGRQRILLVEDNAGLRATTRMLLTVLGYDVTATDGVAAALAVWDRDQSFDLVFSDIVMPGCMNGVQLVRKLQTQLPGLKVLLTSGFADPAMGVDAIGLSGLPILRKPYRKASLEAQLRAVLDEV